MDLVKASAPKPASKVEATQRTRQQAQSEPQADGTKAKKAAEPSPPRATTNTRGELIGQLLNVKA